VRLGKRKPEDALFDASKVDVVSVAADGTVELGIVRAHAWTGSDPELHSLQQKIQTYVSYATDGAMLAAYPETRGLPWRIVVHSQAGPPDAATQHVIDTLSGRLPEYGGGIEARTSD
jgi:hypothetical protein